MSNRNWDRWFLGLAAYISTASKDPSTKVGAVIVRPEDRVVIGLGYNGFPRGVSDTEERYADRAKKYALVAHAELNAILNASSDVKGATLYCTLFCCNECAKAIAQSGIKRVVSPPVPFEMQERWAASFDAAMLIFGEAGISVSWIHE